MSNIRIIHGDSLEAMKAMPDKAYELAICDPPYGIGEDGGKNNSRGSAAGANKWKCSRNTTGVGIASTYFVPKKWDKEPPPQNYFNELLRVSENQIIFGANHFISKNPIDSSCWIIWDKVNGTTDFADCEIAWTSFKTAIRKFTYMWNGMLQGNMKNKEKRIHPTQKPVALYQWLLKNYAKPGDKILDTHGGSCSLAIACDIMGFDADIWEIDEDYYRAAVERFERHKQQTVLEFST